MIGIQEHTIDRQRVLQQFRLQERFHRAGTAPASESDSQAMLRTLTQLLSGSSSTAKGTLVERIRRRRAELAREHGTSPDSTAIIRALRDSGTEE